MKRVTKEWIVVAYYISDAASDARRAINYFLGRRPQMWFPIGVEALEREIGQAGLRTVRTVRIDRYFSEACMVLASGSSH
jgi:hypothetical protein